MTAQRIIDVVDLGADPTQTTDSLPAFNAAVAKLAANAYDVILIPPGKYLLSDTWKIGRPVWVIGGGQIYGHGTTLVVTKGRDGIRVLYQGEFLGGASSSVFENFKIEPTGGTATWTNVPAEYVANESVVVPSTGYAGFAYLCVKSGTSADQEPQWPTSEGLTVNDGTCTWTTVYVAGVKLLGRAELRGIFSSGFSGDGFSVFASTGDGNNANSWLMEGCEASGNVGWGFHTQGADSNAGLAINCISSSNALGGFQDESFLGNSYIACEADGNPVAYSVPQTQTIGADNASVFVGCYSESGQTIRIDGKAMWFGGCTDPGFHNQAYGSGNILTNLRCNTLYFLNDTSDDGTGDSAYCRVGRTGSQTVLEFGFSQDDITPMQLGYGVVDDATADGWVGMQYGTASPFAWSLNNAAEGPGHVWLPHDVYLGNSAIRNVLKSVSGGPPSSGTYTNGDFAREASPQENGMFGFQFVNGHWAAIQPKSTRPSTGPGSGPLGVTDFYYGLTGPSQQVALPAASSFKDGHELVIKDETGLADASPHTISPNGSDTIDGSNTALSISTKYGVLRLLNRNGQWWKIS